MHIGIHLQVSPRNWLPITQAAEAAGFTTVWLPEHLIMPVQMTGEPGTPHEGEPPISGSTPAWDPWLQIAWLAAQTSTVRLGTNVYNVGLRHPFVTARALTTADALSGGRIDFGIGASWLAEEWQALGLDFAGRGGRVDEAIAVMQRLFTEEVIEHRGEHFGFQPVMFEPKPVQRPWPPMFIGGDSPAALRRAARLGDGWLPMSQTRESFPANQARLRQLREQAGRADRPFQVIVHGVGTDDVDELRRWGDLGADGAIVIPWQHPRDALDVIARWGDEIIPMLS